MELSFPFCPVCLDVIEDPVCLPCHHELCLSCYEFNISCANFSCPVCRKRISSWARKQAKQPVNMERKKELEKLYADYGPLDDLKLAVKLQTEENSRVVASSSTGEIHREFLLAKEEFEKERLQQEQLGETEAIRLTEIEQRRLSDIQNQLEADEKLAKELSATCKSFDEPANVSCMARNGNNNSKKNQSMKSLNSSKPVTLKKWFSVLPK